MPASSTVYQDVTATLRRASVPNSRVRSLFPTDATRWARDSDGDGTVEISYGYMTAMPGYTADDETYENATFTAPDTDLQAAVETALESWAEVANIAFVETAWSRSGTPLDIAIGGLTNPADDTYGWAYFPSDEDYAGDFWFNYSVEANGDLTPGTDGYHTIIHELGHALGLAHPFDSDSMNPQREGTGENYQYSVMSYSAHPSYEETWPAAPMLWDVAALQTIYGANTTTRTGNDVYRWDANADFLETIWDAGGTDTLSAANQTRASRLDLTAGNYSSIGSIGESANARNNVAIAYGVTIENATGGRGNDVLIGNRAANRLDGGAGNDTLTGGVGNDTLIGGAGADVAVFTGSAASYTFVLDGAAVVARSGTETDRLSGVENVRFGSGRAVALVSLITDEDEGDEEEDKAALPASSRTRINAEILAEALGAGAGLSTPPGGSDGWNAALMPEGLAAGW